MVAAKIPEDASSLGFLGTVGYDVAEIGGLADFGDVVEWDEENGVGAWGVILALC